MKYLHIVSIFPALTETFVAREVTIMRQIGCDVLIGQLRPVGSRPTAKGFDSLRPFVVPAKLFSLSTIIGLVFFSLTRPKCVYRSISLIFRVIPNTVSFFKLAYIFLVSIELAYVLRHA